MPETRRLFFALWPDDEIRHQLNETAIHYRPEKSRAIRPANLHATLVFLGLQPDELLSRISNAAAMTQGQVFSLSLQQLQVWHRPQVLCLCPEHVPDELMGLQQQLRQELIDVGVMTEDRKYRPHVTLARKVRHKLDTSQLSPEIVWPVNSFSLVESILSAEGVRYQELQSWPLNT